MAEKIILGVDPSHTKTGVAFLQGKKLLGTTIIKFRSSVPIPDRYKEFVIRFKEMIEDVESKGDLCCAVVETPYESIYHSGRRNSPHNLLVYAMAAGSVMTAIAAAKPDLQIIPVSAPSWTDNQYSAITKKGAAFALKVLGIIDDDSVYTEDELDAAFLAFWWRERCLVRGNCEIPQRKKKRRKKRWKN